ncbi:MAG: hypothetical protein NTV81_02920 [Candidatus Komeilibacteria bacterium]|nr:hypothetical protein [Candidatus Komeilibacteria bacterium]
MDTTTLAEVTSTLVATTTQAFIAVTTTAASVAQDAVAKASGFINQIDWSKPNWDLFIILFFVAAVFVYGLSLGRDRVLIMTLAIYISLAIIDHLPFLSKIMDATFWPNFVLFKALTFSGTFVLLFFLLARSALLRSLGARDVYSSWWQVLLFSFLQVGLLVSTVLSFLPDETLSHLSPTTLQIFASETAKFWWVVAPVVGMMFGRAVRRRSRREMEDYI